MIDSFDFIPWAGTITALVTGFAAAVGGWIAARVKGKSDVAAAQAAAQAARSAHSGPEWDMFVQRMEDHYDSRLAGLDKKVDSLEREVSKLREYVEDVKAQYRAALSYILQLLALRPELVEEVPPPQEIREDVLSL